VRFVAFPVTEYDEVLSGYQLSIFQFHFTIYEVSKEVKFTSKLTLAALKEIPLFDSQLSFV
jgi:hypothetical protein